MIPMQAFFLMLLSVFALMGGLRGWAKEIVVAFSVFVALFVLQELTAIVPFLRDLWIGLEPMVRFWTKLVSFAVLVIFGYATPSVTERISIGSEGESRLASFLLGFFLGLLNGFLIVGTLWSFVDEVHYGVPEEQWTVEQAVDEDGYPLTQVIYQSGADGFAGMRPPEVDSVASQFIAYLPPRVISGSSLFLAVAVTSILLVVVLT
jgi:lysylphosphatidylglycerol synthetase-like protein (DUF2156 family)